MRNIVLNVPDSISILRLRTHTLVKSINLLVINIHSTICTVFFTSERARSVCLLTIFLGVIYHIFSYEYAYRVS